MKLHNCLGCNNEFIRTGFNHKYCTKECRTLLSPNNPAQHYYNNKESILAQKKTYYEQNKQTINAGKTVYRREKNKTDINYRLKSNLRSRLNKAIAGDYKTGSAVADLGCSIAEFKVYLESKFKPGMTWDNYGLHGWHIDHVEPLDSFDLSDSDQLKKACHYTNLQPLWAIENLKKG